jgi:hypothetical protein
MRTLRYLLAAAVIAVTVACATTADSPDGAAAAVPKHRIDPSPASRTDIEEAS